MEVVDSQVHSIAPDEPRYPWDRGPEFKDKHPNTTVVRYETILERMAGAGVDAAVLVTPGVYGTENGYVLEAAAYHPDRFAVIGKIDPGAEDLDERLREWRNQPGMLGIRVVLKGGEAEERWKRGGWDPFFEAAERHQVPICLNIPDLLTEIVPVFERYPELVVLIDHMGIQGPPAKPLAPGTFDTLEGVLALARFANVSIKTSGVPALSREPYPFRDVWGPVLHVIDAFGVDRVLWGSDITRLEHAYRDVVGYIAEIPGLTSEDLRRIYGANTRRILRWPVPN